MRKKVKKAKKPVRRRRVYRIGLVGSAGTGKSILAEALSMKLGVPLLSAKVVTQEILDRDGFIYGIGTQIERFLAHRERQRELLEKTTEQQKAKRSFVTDRTTIDLAAYGVCELHDNDVGTLQFIYRESKKYASRYTHLFVCPWKDVPIKPNDKRTLNPWYQYMIHAVERGILDDWGLPYVILQEEDVTARVKEIVGHLGL